MKGNRAAVVGTVGTVMIGAGWAAGLLGTAASASPGIVTIADPATTDGSASTATTPSGTAPSTTDQSTATQGADTTPSATATAPETTPAGVSGTFDGVAVKTRYGTFQAEVVVSDGTVTSVTMLQAGLNDHESSRINQRAIPTLTQRVLDAQTWNVQGVSGASYTSQGVLTSVKDALSQAGL